MITDYSAAGRYKDGSKISTRLTIGTGTGAVVINDEDFVEDGCEIQEDLVGSGMDCLRFGECASCGFAAAFVYTGDSLVGKSVTLEQFPTDHPEEEHLQIGVYKIISDVIDEYDSNIHTITAYDVMYEMHNTDAEAWWSGLFPTDTTTKSFASIRHSLAQHFGLTEESVTLANDSETIKKSFTGSVSFGQILKWLCEINGVFGHIGRDGTLKYVKLNNPRSVYPSATLYPSNSLLPSNGDSEKEEVGYNYFSGTLQFSNGEAQHITQLQIRTSENSVGATVGTSMNNYVIEGNPLTYSMGAEQLYRVATNTFAVISQSYYKPFSLEMMGNPCLEVGDTLEVTTADGTFNGYILHRTLTGVQALTDSISSDGVTTYDDKVNDFSHAMERLNGKYFEVKSDVEALAMIIGDVDKELIHQIEITAAGLTEEIARATGEETRIETTVNGLYAQVNDPSNGLSHKVNVTAGSLESEILRATAAEGTLSSNIQQTASEVELKVNKDGIVSDLNSAMSSGITVRSNGIDINSNGALTINTSKFILDSSGNATFKGSVTGASITGGTISNGTNAPLTIESGVLASQNKAPLRSHDRKIEVQNGEIRMITSALNSSTEYGRLEIEDNGGDPQLYVGYEANNKKYSTTIHGDEITINSGGTEGVVLTSLNWSQYIPNGNGVSY